MLSEVIDGIYENGHVLIDTLTDCETNYKGVISYVLLAFNNRNTKNQSGNAKSSLFNPNNNNLFQTLIAANILRTNIQNSNINNTNLINFAPFTFKNVNMAVNLTTISNHENADIPYDNSQMKSISAFDNREKKIESCNSKRFDYSKLAQECSKTSAASTATTIKENMQYMENSEGISQNNEKQFQYQICYLLQ